VGIIPSSPSHDFLSETLLFDETILEAMMMSERPWEDHHHWSSILPTLSDEDIPLQTKASTLNGKETSHVPSTSYGVSSEWNMSNISKTITIDIFVKPDVMETNTIAAKCSLEDITLYKALFQEFHDIFTWSYEEILGIDPWIVVHEIKMYAGGRPVWKRLWLIHPKKVAAIKFEVKKLLKDDFIYLVPLIEWVSNIMPVTKKHGTIHVCVDYQDLNKVCPMDNYPTPFIDQIINYCARCEVFLFMDGFSSYNQIDITGRSTQNGIYLSMGYFFL
jgi:hypothetical protein